ncbi:hypothetical protein Z945_1938 [Sulfitobacter noctilucae]|uniref:DUF6456 domain-containing protein n=1 Tax=Sulfitobacter noctilucae TaxID=1342302 RepID=UPI00046931A1|nr:DUF6456 domain-containing protein [Sulfitobacter noctilucae]KIN60955.1 hypothetical protein Z945_1938 [Sulfitobacter noctilucae]
MFEQVEICTAGNTKALPEWVPAGALHYLAHTEKGTPIRGLARAAGCHASTILRQIRKIEMRRDDPLVDGALRRLGAQAQNNVGHVQSARVKDQKVPSIPDDATLTREAMRVLRRLCENGAVLAVAAELDKAVVVRDGPSGIPTRTAVVDTPIAQAMALKDWITPSNAGRILRYHITGTGRTALAGFIDRFGGPAYPIAGVEEAQADFVHHAETLGDTEEDGGANRSRYCAGESPLAALARRRDKDGKPFLADTLVHAGERLREDFELAQMDASVAQNWDHFLTAGTQKTHATGGGEGGAPAQARARVRSALDHLGVGLADVVLRCCCFLEGLEITEKRLGWSARSGKIVLRIALIRLKRHYDETVGPGGPLIG